MKKMHIQNRLCVIPALLFCIGLQGTETTEPNTVPTDTEIYSHNNLVTQQDLDGSDLDPMRKPRPKLKPKVKPKPNNTGPQNIAESYNTSYDAEPYNKTGSYNNIPESQNSVESFDARFRTNGANATIGYVIDTIGFDSAPRAVATQKDNKIIVAGIKDSYPLLVRYNDNGSLDADFGGIVDYGPGVLIETNMGQTSFFNAIAIQEQSDLKIITVGSTEGTNRSVGKCVIARYKHGHVRGRDGVLDPEFGTNGIVKTNIFGELNAVAIQADGKIVVAGYNTYNTANTQIVLMRYNENGTLDTDFGLNKNGIVFTSVGMLSRANGITIQEHDGKIIVVGSTNAGNRNDMLIARYDKDGILDTSFGNYENGIIILNIANKDSIAHDVVVQENHRKIVIVGTSTSENRNLFTTVRLNENGAKDTSFGTAGISTLNPNFYNNLHDNAHDNAFARSVALGENGKIIVMGYTIASNNDNSFSLVCYDQNFDDGRLDKNFGREGMLSSTLKLNDLSNKAILSVDKPTGIPTVGAIQYNGTKLVLVGSYSAKNSTTNNQFAVARFLN